MVRNQGDATECHGKTDDPILPVCLFSLGFRQTGSALLGDGRGNSREYDDKQVSEWIKDR